MSGHICILQPIFKLCIFKLNSTKCQEVKYISKAIVTQLFIQLHLFGDKSAFVFPTSSTIRVKINLESSTKNKRHFFSKTTYKRFHPYVSILFKIDIDVSFFFVNKTNSSNNKTESNANEQIQCMQRIDRLFIAKAINRTHSSPCHRIGFVLSLKPFFESHEVSFIDVFFFFQTKI